MTLLSRVRDRGEVQLLNAIQCYVQKMYKIIFVKNMENSHTVANVHIAIAVVGSKWIQNCEGEMNCEKQNHINVACNTQQNGLQVIKQCEQKKKTDSRNKKTLCTCMGHHIPTLHTEHRYMHSCTINEW